MTTARQLGFSTRLIHAGEEYDGTNGPSAPPIVASSTFHQPPEFVAAYTMEGADWNDTRLAEHEPYEYSRHANPTIRRLEAKVAASENAAAAVVFSSGMAAATGLLSHKLQPGDHLVMSDVAYVGVSEWVRQSLPRMQVETTFVDGSDLSEVAAAIRPHTRLVYIETPVNPILRLTDIQGVAALAQGAGAEVAVDSTWATPIATRPLELGADYVVHSLTKYFCGHGDTLGGAVVGAREAMRALRIDARVHQGGVLSPFDAWLIMRGMDTLPLRMEAHARSALQVARFLKAHPKVTRVIYPGLDSHPQRDLAKRQMANTSGMLAFQVAQGPVTAVHFARHVRIFHYAVSLGHQRSLIVYLPTTLLQKESFHLDDAHLARYRAYAGDGVFRVSIGLEDADDLCAELACLLDGV